MYRLFAAIENAFMTLYLSQHGLTNETTEPLKQPDQMCTEQPTVFWGWQWMADSVCTCDHQDIPIIKVGCWSRIFLCLC